MVLQNGVGEGTTPRKRRTPRMRVQDVATAEASGATLGADGYPHPLETTAFGELKVTERDVASILEEILASQLRVEAGMILNDIIPDMREGFEG